MIQRQLVYPHFWFHKGRQALAALPRAPLVFRGIFVGAMLALVGCGGGYRSSGDGNAVLSVSASAPGSRAGGPNVRLVATGNGAEEASWSLVGPGRLDASSGTVVNYVPPSVSALTEDETATITVMAAGQRAVAAFAVTGSSTIEWDRSQIAGANLTKAVYGAGKYLLLEESGAVYVGDGRIWVRVTVLPGINAASIAYGNGRFVMVGSKYAGTYAGAVLSSADGLAWADVTPMRSNGSQNLGLIYELGSVVFSNGKFTAVGRLGTTIASADGSAWRDVSVPEDPSPRYDRSWAGSNQFLTISGEAAKVWTGGIMIPPLSHGLGLPGQPIRMNLFSSPDGGTTWSYLTPDIESPCYLSGPLVSAGAQMIGGGYCNGGASAVVISTDGAKWSQPTSMGSQAQALVPCVATVTGSLNGNFTSTAYGPGRYVVVACGHVLSSVNGTDWGLATGAFRTTGSPLKLKDITYAAERFVAVGGPDVLISR